MKNLNLSIRARILLGFALALSIVLFMVFTLWVSMQLAQVKESLVKVSEERVQYALLASAIDKNVVPIQQFVQGAPARDAI